MSTHSWKQVFGAVVTMLLLLPIPVYAGTLGGGSGWVGGRHALAAMWVCQNTMAEQLSANASVSYRLTNYVVFCDTVLQSNAIPFYFGCKTALKIRSTPEYSSHRAKTGTKLARTACKSSLA